MVVELLGRLARSSPAAKRVLWKTWYQFLSRRFHRSEWTFMNYGYAPVSGNSKTIDLEPEDEEDRYYAQLYYHVASGLDLSGKDVLEVGSGRGGGCSFIARYLKPRSMTGIDYSETAVKLCRNIHSVEGLTFVQGDAERLPFEAHSFDVVMNVESSHCYGSMEAFVHEVFRVLKPGGRFLFTDFRGAENLDTLRVFMTSAGFSIIEEENITKNVVKAMDHTGEQKSGLVNAHVPAILKRSFRHFAGVPGSRVYNSFKNGEVQYVRYVLEKRL